MKKVYMCFSTDIIHSGHISIIEKASRLGDVYIGVLPDDVVAGYKRYPLIEFEERKKIISHIKGVKEVVEQATLSYADNLRKYKPDYVVHGDDWKIGPQKEVRDEVIAVLNEIGGELVEFPYGTDLSQNILDEYSKFQLSIPDMRRGRLKKILKSEGFLTAMEAHNGLTGVLVENTKVKKGDVVKQFDAMWVSSLCDSTAKGKPDIELVDITSRVQTINEILEVTYKPIIFDGDTGGLPEHLAYNVRTLERLGISAIIIEDKIGLKKNSLFGTDVEQTQDSIENFSNKIRVAKQAQKTGDFMVIARIESLILEKGMDDALERAFAYVDAGADGIMIHSRKPDPDEIFEFIERFRSKNTGTPIVVVPTSFNKVTETEFREKGANIVIYANHLTRSAFPAMKKVCEIILENERSSDADEYCMSIKDILNIIPQG